MQTNLAPEYAAREEGREAEAILRKCVHCGFCTATCPTYQLLDDIVIFAIMANLVRCLCHA